jgi:hypothetical protein
MRLKLQKFIAELRWLRDSRRFKRNRFKKGRGEDFHHE